MKIAVYAICKDEMENLPEWLENVKDADYVCVLDTGSTDGTWERGVGDVTAYNGLITRQCIFKTFRFDAARNESLKLIPPDTDVCICMDLDERLCPGWRETLEREWMPGATCGSYEFQWGADGATMRGFKIHTYGAIKWVHAVHEVPEYLVDKVMCDLSLRMEHRQKQKDRSQYLQLLTLAVQEEPDCARNWHYLGREQYYRGEWENAAETLRHYLRLPGATWDEERAASMRYIALCYKCMAMMAEDAGKAEDSMERWELWEHRAAMESDHMREPWVDLAQEAHNRGNMRMCRRYASAACRITQPGTYPVEAYAWGSRPYDLRSIGAWNTGARAMAVRAAKNAMEKEPGNERIRENIRIMEEIMNGHGDDGHPADGG